VFEFHYPDHAMDVALGIVLTGRQGDYQADIIDTVGGMRVWSFAGDADYAQIVRERLDAAHREMDRKMRTVAA
jgi:hypothetical protein